MSKTYFEQMRELMENAETWKYSVEERPVFCLYHTPDYSLVEMEVG